MNTCNNAPYVRAALRSIVGAVALAASVPAAWSAPITYNVDFNRSPDLTLTGTITTDGSIGALTAANITGFSLTVSYVPDVFDAQPHTGTFSFDFGAVSCGISCGLSADASNLTFAPPAAGGFLKFENGAYRVSLGQNVDLGNGSTGFFANISEPGAYNTPFLAGSQSLVLGTGQGSVPEPGALSLAALALAGAAATRRRRNRRTEAAV